ncbi:MAG: 2Fe-2S iron-sulfur cluster binding domain-containing protein [Arenicella sp.]|nr:2Fe-2S iron-sulfur cluster binding domain-containing protein [Arenicella sp.]
MTNKITVIAVDGQQQDVEFDQGDSLMEVLREAGYDEIMAMCGGCCSCATCHVKITDQAAYQLPPVEEDEEILLSLADAYELDSSRLSCQITMGEAQQGMTVAIVDAD